MRLFQLSGIEVFLHWSWFVVAVYEISSRSKRYPSLVWNLIEYLALFVIMLLHELAIPSRRSPLEHCCRTTGECGVSVSPVSCNPN
jgi:hypothetical protein